MRPRRRSAVTYRHNGCVALFLLFLASCNVNVTESSRISPVLSYANQLDGCASELGSYALPKAYLHVVVSQSPSTPPAIQPVSVDTVRHIDPSLLFCLDYLASSAAHDKITIRKWIPPSTTTPNPNQPTPFLGAVIVNVADRSAYIVEALVRAAFIAVSGNPNFSITRETAPAQTVADLEYDPFNPDESAAINERLTRLGYCLVLESYTFERRGPSVAGYCNAPLDYPRRHTMVTKAYLKAEAKPADKHLPGLLYRPRVPFRLEIYRRIDARDPWQLVETSVVHLENLSPVLSLDIRRAAFANRTASFIFDAGTLKLACVSKSSEVEGFVDIPLQISKSIVALPASIVSVQIDQIKNQTRLIQAEQQLYQVQQAYLGALASGGTYNTVQGAPTSATTYTLPNLPGTLSDLAPEPTAPSYVDLLNNQDINKLCQPSS